MFWNLLPNRLWLVILIALTLMSAAFYLVLGQGAKESVTNQLLTSETTVSRATAGNIASFFHAFGESTALYAQRRSMERFDSTTEEDLDDFVVQWGDSGLVSGVVLTDDEGIVRFNSNVSGTHDVGGSLADRDYFTWAQNQDGEGEYYVGAPVESRLGASKDQVIVTVTSPVFVNDSFSGAVTAAVKLELLTERFMELMKVSDETNVYLIDQEGGILYSSSENTELSDNVKESIDLSQEGQFQKEDRLIAYSQIPLGSQTWLVVATSPNDKVSSAATPFYIRQVAVLVWASLTTLAFGLFVSRQYQNKLWK